MPIEAGPVRNFYNSKEWRTQRARIRARAGGRCECRGECGRDHVYKIVNEQLLRKQGARCWERGDREGVGDGVVDGGRVSLGVAHRNHDTGERVPDAQLVALCSGCHMRYDVEQHLRSRKTNRRRRLEARGQRRLFS